MAELGPDGCSRVRGRLPDIGVVDDVTPRELAAFETAPLADLIVIDIGEPNVRTVRGLLEISASSPLGNLPILITSVLPDSGFAMGLIGLLRKPVTPRRVWLSVERLDLPPGACVLVADPDPAVVEPIARRLEFQSLQILRADTGAAAIELASANQPSLAIINPLLPDKQGFAAIEQIRRQLHEPLPRLMVLLPESIDTDSAEWLTAQIASERNTPLSNDEIQREVERAMGSSPARLGRNGTALPSATAPLVLVVEDDPVYQRLLSVFLHEAGCRVRVAENGREALDAMAAEVPRLVTLDLGLPEMDGLSFLGSLRARPTLAHVPVIVLSGLADRGAVPGTAAFLSKPFARRDIESLLRQFHVVEPPQDAP